MEGLRLTEARACMFLGRNVAVRCRDGDRVGRLTHVSTDRAFICGEHENPHVESVALDEIVTIVVIP